MTLSLLRRLRRGDPRQYEANEEGVEVPVPRDLENRSLVTATENEDDDDEIRSNSSRPAPDGHGDAMTSQDSSSSLPKDVFSLLLIAPTCSLSFWYSLVVFGWQMGILTLMIWNLLKDAPNDGNPFDVPLSSEPDVIAAQAMALMVALLTQSDVRLTLELWRLDYTNNNNNSTVKIPWSKWMFANACRLTEGLLSLFVSFIFIVQATAVLDLFLNFAAVQFVSSLDNLGFELAQLGYATRRLQRDAQRVLGVRLLDPQSGNDTATRGCAALPWRALYLLLLVAFYGGWLVIRIRQANGYYYNFVCQTFDVRFGDQYYDFFVGQPCNITTISTATWFEENDNGTNAIVRFENETDSLEMEEEEDGCPWKNRTRPLHYSPFSDSYLALRNGNGDVSLDSHGRPVYYQHGRPEGFGAGSPPGKLSYCPAERAWVFSIDGVTKPTTDSCNWLLRSTEARYAYSLHQAPTTAWSIWTGTLQRASEFSISCAECQSAVDCNYHGTCVNKQCICNEPWIGTHCQTCASCSELQQVVLGEFQSVNETSTFVRLDDVVLYNRPVYYKNGTSSIGVEQNFGVEVDEVAIDILFYAGTRWYIMNWRDFVANSTIGLQDTDVDRLRDIMSNFHSTWHLDDTSSRTISFYTDVTDNPMPLEVGWNLFNPNQPLSIWSGEVSGYPIEVKDLKLTCAIVAEKTTCAAAQQQSLL